MGLSLSTSWNAFRHKTAQGIVSEITTLGFQELELSFNLTREIIDQLHPFIKRREITITSLHNYCPIPDGISRENALPDVYSIASLDETERSTAVTFTKKTIDTASALGAKAVVLHCGRVEIPDRTKELIDLYIRDKTSSPEYADLKADIIRQRSETAKPFFENALKSLAELNSYAAEKKILLGIENRYYYREIPTLEETGAILNEFKNSNIYYWHDVGHAQLMDNLGLASHKAYLDNYGQKMIGMHLHDISGYHDHKAPGKGKFNFKALLPYLKNETIKVIEAHYPAQDKDIRTGKRLLEKTFHGKI